MVPGVLYFGCVLFLLGACRSEDVHYFVGVAGTDSNDGLSSPVKTLQKAISLVSSPANKGKNLFIELLPGYHDLTSPLHIKHSGSFLTIRSHNDQEVHVTGGRHIPLSSLKHVTDHKILNALPAAARQHVRYVHLPDLHITSYGSIDEYGSGKYRKAMLEVFYNGQPFRLARWPNEGHMNVAATPDGRRGHRIQYNSTRPSSWAFLDDIWVYGFWHYAWSDRALHVKTLDTKNMMIIFDNKTNVRHGFRPGALGAARAHEGGYFRFFNVFSELDEPGEYYLDKKTGNLYFWLPTTDGNAKSADDIHVSILDRCITIDNNVHNVKLSGFIIEACREKGLVATSVTNITVEKMEIRNTGDFGLYFNGRTTDCTITKSVFRDSDGGVYIAGGDRKLLQGAGNTVEDCKFYHFTREGVLSKPAVLVNGVGNFVRYNEISHGQSTGITFIGNDHVIEYNNIHHVCRNVSNCGAIGASTDWTYRGNKIRYNTIHDITRIYPGGNNRGIMLDNMLSSADITNNVFYNNQVHVMIGGGRDNIIANNVMYGAGKFSIEEDGRGKSWSSAQLTNIRRRMKSVPYNNTLWSARYPQLARIDSQHDNLPEGNQIHKNIYYNTGKNKEFVHGASEFKTPAYFNITDIGYSYGIGDHYDVTHGDFRLRCHAAQWANRVNFDQVVSPNDVGPRYDVGPPFHKIVHKTVHLTGSPSVCPTVAPNTHPPMPAYLPDGAGQTPLFTVFDEGCWLKVDKCTNDPDAVGTYRDMYGERYDNAANSEAACLHRAILQWHFCGSKPNEAVTAVYGPSGTTTIGGDGCFIATYGCPKHGGPADGHVVEGKIFRDHFAEHYRNATTDQEQCLKRASDQWHFCGSNPNHTATAIFRPTGATRTAGAGCWIQMKKCPKQPSMRTMFYDAVGATNAQTDDRDELCFTRAEYYWTLCGSDSHYPVTAHYRPTAKHSTYPYM